MPVPVDMEGLDVAAGIARCGKARAVFVTPSHQFPLGATMSASCRLRFLDWAQNSAAWIIEDDYDSEYRYQSMPVAALQGRSTGRDGGWELFQKAVETGEDKCLMAHAQLLLPQVSN